MSNAKPFIFLLLVAVMLCCNGAWALEGTRDGKYIDGISQDGCEYSLYESYSYTYEDTKRSFTGRCAVLTKFKSEGACIPSTVTCDGYEYPVVALGERCYNESEHSLPSSVSIPNTVEVIEAFAFDKGDNSLVGITLEDGDKVLFCYRSSNGAYHNGAFSWNDALKTVYIGRDLDYQDRSEGDYDYAPFHNGEFKIDVTIGPKVTEIPAYCFHDPYGSCGVKTVDFSNATSLTSIGKGAFYDNDLLTGTLVLSTPLLTTIGESAFYDCDELKTVDFRNATSLTSIGKGAFYDNDLLSGTLVLSTPLLTAIGESAFYNCDELKTVYLLSSHVSSFGSSCFEGQTIYVNSSSLCDSYKKQYADGKFEAIPESRMLRYQTTDEKKLELLNCMCSIYDDGEGIMYFDKDLYSLGAAFVYCSSLQSVTIPNSVTGIDKWAFANCYSLQSVTIPSSVTYIGEGAFARCSSLQSVAIPNSVTSIGGLAFSDCNSLQSVTIPNSVTYLGESALSCLSLQSITFKSYPSRNQEEGYAFLRYEDTKTTVILDLTDSEKPYIGIPVAIFPKDFNKACYHRTITPGKWGTIVLPFVPESTTGLEFYDLKGMTTGGEDGGTLAFTSVSTIEAGKPYLFRNTSSSADFTLTKANPGEADFVLTPQEQEPVNGFTFKGNYQQNLQLNGSENTNLYYLKDNEFYHATGKINIAPFRAYIEGDGAAQSKGFMLMIEDKEGAVNAVPGIMDDKGEIDETEGIYDLNGRRLTTPLKGQFNIIRTKSGKSIKRRF